MSTHWPPREAELTLVHADAAAAEPLRTALACECARRVTVLTDPAEVLAQVRHHVPDLIVVHGRLDEDRQRLLEDLQLEVAVGDHVPIVVITDEPDAGARLLALELGAVDVLVEPVSEDELCHRVRNHLAARLVVATLQRASAGLERQLAERDAELERRAFEQLEQLRLALVARDRATAEHGDRMARGVWMLAVATGASLETAERLRHAAPLHDVGKLGVPDEVLRKRERLTDEERREVEQHPFIGARLLGASHAPLLKLAAAIALSHHERWDGTGYPYGLAGERIPKAARIVAVVDVFDVLTHPGPHMRAWPVDRAVQELERVAGSQLDPELVRVFVRDCVPRLPHGDAGLPGGATELVIDLAERRPARP
jgi:putative two-component system response regulator